MGLAWCYSLTSRSCIMQGQSDLGSTSNRRARHVCNGVFQCHRVSKEVHKFSRRCMRMLRPILESRLTGACHVSSRLQAATHVDGCLLHCSLAHAVPGCAPLPSPPHTHPAMTADAAAHTSSLHQHALHLMMYCCHSESESMWVIQTLQASCNCS